MDIMSYKIKLISCFCSFVNNIYKQIKLDKLKNDLKQDLKNIDLDDVDRLILIVIKNILFMKWLSNQETNLNESFLLMEKKVQRSCILRNMMLSIIN